MRIYVNYAYLCMMKAKLNITIEERLLEQVKVYAIEKKVSLSALIEDYLKKLVHKASGGKNIIDFIERLEPDEAVVAESNEKNAFYEAQKGKYGF